MRLKCCCYAAVFKWVTMVTLYIRTHLCAQTLKEKLLEKEHMFSF